MRTSRQPGWAVNKKRAILQHASVVKVPPASFDKKSFPEILKKLNGMWRSLVARTLGVGEAAGSNPVIPIMKRLSTVKVESRFFLYILSTKQKVCPQLRHTNSAYPFRLVT